MKLQIAKMAMALVLVGVAVVPQAQGATVNNDHQVSINVLAGGSCTLSSAGGLYESYDPANPSPIEHYSSGALVCSFGTTWSLSYDQGMNADAGSNCFSPLRRANNASSFLAYELYRDAGRTELLGCDPANGFQGSGTGSNQYPLVYYRIPAGQSPTATGTHSDTVVATLTF